MRRAGSKYSNIKYNVYQQKILIIITIINKKKQGCARGSNGHYIDKGEELMHKNSYWNQIEKNLQYHKTQL